MTTVPVAAPFGATTITRVPLGGTPVGPTTRSEAFGTKCPMTAAGRAVVPTLFAIVASSSCSRPFSTFPSTTLVAMAMTTRISDTKPVTAP